MLISLGYKPGSTQMVFITYEYRYIAADIHHRIAVPGMGEHGGGRSRRAASLYTQALRAQTNSARRKKSTAGMSARVSKPSPHQVMQAARAWEAAVANAAPVPTAVAIARAWATAGQSRPMLPAKAVAIAVAKAVPKPPSAVAVAMA